tara:strand:- start:6747 stop:6986 length:240 start_codon:yes stop_codon:yes gene_type:complete
MTEKTKAVGFKDMHPMQIQSLLELVHMTLNLATLTGDDEIIEDVEAYTDEMVKLFGGQGVKLEETEYNINDLGVGRSLH